jgi:hypothetical protein
VWDRVGRRRIRSKDRLGRRFVGRSERVREREREESRKPKRSRSTCLATKRKRCARSFFFSWLSLSLSVALASFPFVRTMYCSSRKRGRRVQYRAKKDPTKLARVDLCVYWNTGMKSSLSSAREKLY